MTAALSSDALDPVFRSARTLGGWRVAELWTDAERLFAFFGLVAATPAEGE